MPSRRWSSRTAPAQDSAAVSWSERRRRSALGASSPRRSTFRTWRTADTCLTRVRCSRRRGVRRLMRRAPTPNSIGSPLFIGGKSMGGRIASQAAAASALPIAGLVYLGYPLHPPGKPDQPRDRHLPDIKSPMLFVQGTRDAFGTSDEIRALLPRLNAGTVLHEIVGGDHSFKVPARAGRHAGGGDGRAVRYRRVVHPVGCRRLTPLLVPQDGHRVGAAGLVGWNQARRGRRKRQHCGR